MRRVLSLVMAILFVVSIPVTALAVEVDLYYGNVTITDTEVIHSTAEEQNKTESHDGSVTVIQSNSETATSNTVSVTTTTEDVTVTLDNVNIESQKASVDVKAGEGTSVTIELDEENTLTSKSSSAIHKDTAAGELVIQDHDGNGTLTATTKQNYSAAIGADNRSKNVQNITIDGGTITATAKNGRGAAIGSAWGGDASDITINGGEIKATSSYGAGIGSGNGGGDALNIEINGGTVTAKSTWGAAIGSGQDGDADGITINGGVITADGSSGAGIGSGDGGNASNIKITDGQITADSNSGAAIGGGQDGDAKNIEITGGQIVAENLHPTAKYAGSAIGSGVNGTTENVSISNDANVIASTIVSSPFGVDAEGNEVEADTSGLTEGANVTIIKGEEKTVIEVPRSEKPVPVPVPVPAPAPAPTEPEEPEAPAQVEVKVDTGNEVVIDLVSGTQDGKPMEKIEAEVEVVKTEDTDTAEPVVIPEDTTIVIHKVEITAEETVEEVAKDEVGMVFTISCIREETVINLPGVVKLSIPAPDFNLDGFALVFVNADGEQIEIPYKLVDGKLVFETEFVGLYMIVKK